MAQVVSINDFGGGINHRLPATDIEDNQLVDALNLELDRRQSLRSRGGASRISTASAPSAITGLHYYRVAAGSATVIASTSAGPVYQMSVGGGNLTLASAGVTLPASADWHWVTFNDKAIGVNGSTAGGEANPVEKNGIGANVTAHGTAPRGRLIAVWNNRLFIVDATQHNVLKWSAVNSDTDWTTTGILGTGSANIGQNDGDTITALAVFAGNLWIFKRTKIYQLSAGSPVVDSSQWDLRLYANGAGCISPYTVQQVGDDLVFLSDEGVLSLRSVQELANTRKSPVSALIPELASLSKATTKYLSATLPDKGQYWVVVPEGLTSSTLDVAWVLDYTRLAAGGSVAWTRFNGSVVGGAYATVLDSGQPRLYIGTSAGSILRYADAGVWADQPAGVNVSFRKLVRTKAFAMGERLQRKEFLRLGIELFSEVSEIELDISYRLDERDARQKTVRKVFNTTLAADNWDEGEWDTALWSGNESANLDTFFRLVGVSGRRSQTLQLFIQDTDDVGQTGGQNPQFVFKGLRIDFNPLTHVGVED